MSNSWMRWLGIVLFGALFNILLNGGLIDHDETTLENVRDYCATILIAMVAIHGLLLINSYMDKRLPWYVNPRTRFWRQFFFSFIFIISAVNLLGFLVISLFFRQNTEVSGDPFLTLIPLTILYLVFSLLFNFAELIIHLAKEWRKSRLQVEAFRQQSAEMRFEMLKQQVNPHFLFNSLNTLSSLVYHDQDLAARFIRQLSKVYRYVLEHRDREIVQLQDELKMLEPLIFLMETRFNENLDVTVKVSDSSALKYIAPMSLQMLLENAIKHNIVSERQPLSITIIDDGEYVSLENNFQPKNSTTPASGMGLNNIGDRYAFLTQREVIVRQTSASFSVGLPLLSRDEVRNLKTQANDQ